MIGEKKAIFSNTKLLLHSKSVIRLQDDYGELEKNTRKKFSKKKNEGKKEASNRLRATAQDKRQTKRQDRRVRVKSKVTAVLELDTLLRSKD